MRKTVKMLVAMAMVSGLLLGPFVSKGTNTLSAIGGGGGAAPCGWAPGGSGT